MLISDFQLKVLNRQKQGEVFQSKRIIKEMHENNKRKFNDCTRMYQKVPRLDYRLECIYLI